MEGPDVTLMLPFLRQRRDRFAVFPDAQQTFEQIVEDVELHIALSRVRSSVAGSYPLARTNSCTGASLAPAGTSAA